MEVAIAGVMTALKNELIFVDRLTGLYNRVYLEFLQKQACKKKGVWEVTESPTLESRLWMIS